MFNGIVETVGTIKQHHINSGSMDFTITTPLPFTDLFIGASIAVNGVCLTVTRFTDVDFDVTAVPETLRLTNLGDLQKDHAVNLERAAKMDGRNGGHHVQGHVDTVGTISGLQPDGDALAVKIQIPSALTKYIVKKGYVALDGMSITVVEVGEDWFEVTFIPQTRQSTIVKQYRVGTKMNIEVDMLGKYIEKLLEARSCNPI